MNSSSNFSSSAAAAGGGSVALSSHGWAPHAGWPRAAIACLVDIVLIEAASSRQREWLADMASWQWESKRHLLDQGALQSEVAIFGSSVLFHGLDSEQANAAATGPERVVNLALNGMALPQQAQLIQERLVAAPATQTIVLELRESIVPPSSWMVAVLQVLGLAS